MWEMWKSQILQAIRHNSVSCLAFRNYYKTALGPRGSPRGPRAGRPKNEKNVIPLFQSLFHPKTVIFPIRSP